MLLLLKELGKPVFKFTVSFNVVGISNDQISKIWRVSQIYPTTRKFYGKQKLEQRITKYLLLINGINNEQNE